MQSITYTLFKDGKKVKTLKPNENTIVEFNNLENANYKIEVKAPENIKFIKDINSFDFNFDSDGEFVIVNDEIDTYTYRKGFTDNYIKVRQDIQNTDFNINVKKVLLDYSSTAESTDDTQQDKDVSNETIRNLSILLCVLVALYIVLKIIFFKLNKKC